MYGFITETKKKKQNVVLKQRERVKIIRIEYIGS